MQDGIARFSFGSNIFLQSSFAVTLISADSWHRRLDALLLNKNRFNLLYVVTPRTKNIKSTKFGFSLAPALIWLSTIQVRAFFTLFDTSGAGCIKFSTLKRI